MRIKQSMLCGTVLLAMMAGISGVAYADGCYLCQGGGYVAFTGDDTFEKRRDAKEKFGCVVQGTTSSCQNPKGSVSVIAHDTDLRVACEDHDHDKKKDENESKQDS